MLMQLLLVLTLMVSGQTERPAGAAPPSNAKPKAAKKEIAQAPAPAAVPKPDLSAATATWLVNLARHQGHLVGRTDPRSASLHVLALLEAAVSISPDCAEAHYWLYDLYFRMGWTEEAHKALSQYVRLTPGDDAARLRCLEFELADRQTAEDRVEYLKVQLQQKPLSRAYESELHRWLAKHYCERRETEFAATEVEQALRLNPMNVPARQLAYELFGETEPALQRVEVALQLIAMNPSQANLVWDLAEFLDRLSLHTYAQEWYERALRIHESTGAGPVPPEFWQKLALSYVSSGDFEKARQAADEALEIDPAVHTARLLRANAETKLGQPEAAEEDVQFVAQAYEARVDEVVSKKLTAEAAEIAWFYGYHRPDKDRALRLAKIAMEDAEPGSLARLAYGYALRLNGRADEAQAVLDPLANIDQLAALEVARLHIERGNRGQAVTLLHKAATIQYSGIAYQLIADLLAKHGETAPQPPLHNKVIAALDKFQRDVFDYYQRPEDFLKFTLRFADDRLPVTGPINVTFRLENVGPFAVTFGEGFMARPLVAVCATLRARQEPKQAAGADEDVKSASAERRDERPEAAVAFDDYLQVLLNSRTMLLPGESTEKTVAIDVGPMREHLLRNVTQPLTLEISALFDPVYEDGKLDAGAGTIQAASIQAMRLGVEVSPPAFDALLARANSPDAAERAAVAEILGALRADAEQHPDRMETKALPPDAVNATLATLLADPDWSVRARATVAVGWAKLDPRVTNAAAGGVRGDAHPVVKLLAVRLFAQHHGEKFVQVLNQISKADPSPFVRTMAESYLPRPGRVSANRAGAEADDATP